MVFYFDKILFNRVLNDAENEFDMIFYNKKLLGLPCWNDFTLLVIPCL